ncbi:aromatic amino acid ammonia-lyase [Leifsonia shinshuensis]|uniref:Histidine ammonia-lyase n=1 Tax=Leifsonia shinshuensis TaxID=150026 RepID=A0A7G6YE15_9MICO|nr:aromatic amino acid ammonia-lyase [Leifsonia shinshuensis]QNE36730.1 histidine ammonia-lyase [Leifsonia shinshuensis]
MSPDNRMTIETIRAVACDHAPVVVSAETRSAVTEAHLRIANASGLRAYGRTTGVGFNRTTSVPEADTEHGMRLLRSHAVEVGAPIPAEQVRAMLVVRLNQLSHVGSGIRPDVLDGVARMLNEDALPTVHEHGASIGTADLSALARAALTLTGELPASRPLAPLPPFGADSALPFMSSSALTIGRAALAAAAFWRLEAAAIEIFALTAFAVGANAEHWSAPAAEAAASTGVRDVAARIRRVFGTRPLPERARVQDPFGIRAFPLAAGALHEAMEQVTDTVESLASVAQENPLFVLDGEHVEAVHHGGFFQLKLALNIDAALNALAAVAPLSTARVRMLNDPDYTGLARFLASGPDGSSGTMIVEYVLAASGAEIRAAAMPAASGTTVLSGGVEEDASFASQGVLQLERAVAAWRTVLACEFLLAVRAIRQSDRLDSMSPAVRAIIDGEPEFTGGDADRDLRPALEACLRVLDQLGSVLPE